MKKDYQKPDAEYISLLAEEAITESSGVVDGSTGYEEDWEW